MVLVVNTTQQMGSVVLTEECCGRLCISEDEMTTPRPLRPIVCLLCRLQVKLIADMLLPLLEALAAQPHLIEPGARPAAMPSITISSSGGSMSLSGLSLGGAASSNGGALGGPSSTSSNGAAPVNSSQSGQTPVSSPAPGGGPVSPVVAAAVATLQLRLLEVFFFLPAAPVWASCHGVLLQLCGRQLAALGGSRVSPEAAAAVCSCSLRHMLNLQDAMLGPWLPGRHVLEDELRNFVGEWGDTWWVGQIHAAAPITGNTQAYPVGEGGWCRRVSCIVPAPGGCLAPLSRWWMAAVVMFSGGPPQPVTPYRPADQCLTVLPLVDCPAPQASREALSSTAGS
jgi:hypothetical protein